MSGAPTQGRGVAALLLGAAAALAQPVVVAQESDRFRPIDGDEFAGVLERVTEDGEVSIRLEDGSTRRLALELLQGVVLGARGEAPATKLEDTLWLRSGLGLPAELQRATDGTGAFAVPWSRGEIQLPWRFVQAVRFDEEGSLDPGFAEAAAKPSDSTDLLYARRDEGQIMRVSVRFVGVDGDQLKVRFGGEEQAIDLSRVHGLVFGVDHGAPPDVAANPRVVLALRNGRELPGALAEMDRTRCRLRLDEGVVLDFATSLVASIQVQSDRLVHLTDLTPKTEQTAALDRTWPPLLDQGPGGGVIRLGGRSFARGLVLFPRTRMTYAIDGRFDVLETTIGLEDRAGSAAHAVMRVLGDDRVLFDSGPVTPGSKPRELKIPVTEVQRLTLEADFGDNLDLGDLCVFAAPRLLKR